MTARDQPKFPVAIYAGVLGPRKNLCSFAMKREHLVLCTNMYRADHVASGTWPSREYWKFCSAGSAGIAARFIAVSMVKWLGVSVPIDQWIELKFS